MPITLVTGYAPGRFSQEKELQHKPQQCFNQHCLPGFCGGERRLQIMALETKTMQREGERQIPPTASPGLRKTHRQHKSEANAFPNRNLWEGGQQHWNMQIFKVTQGPLLWWISYSLEISANNSWTFIHTESLAKYDPLLSLCKANPARQ